MNTPNLNNSANQYKMTGLSRSALLRRMTPSAETSAISLSTPRVNTSSSRISNKSVIIKKKLEFAAKKHLKEDKKEANIEELSCDELKIMIEKRKEQLRVLQRHELERQELTGYIEKWKSVGNDALEELTNHLKLSREELMIKLNLAEDLFD